MARKYEEIMEYTEDWMKGLLGTVVTIRFYLETVISIIRDYRNSIVDKSTDNVITEVLNLAKDWSPRLEQYKNVVKCITESIDEINGSEDLDKIDKVLETLSNICESFRKTEYMFNQQEVKKFVDFLEKD